MSKIVPYRLRVKRSFLLVSAVQWEYYSGNRHAKVDDFRRKCIARTVRQIAMTQKQTETGPGAKATDATQILHFILYDFSAGTVEDLWVEVDRGIVRFMASGAINAAVVSTGNTAQWKVSDGVTFIPRIVRFRAPTRHDYSSGGQFLMTAARNGKNVMSILDVYREIAKIGRDADEIGTLEELSFFGHAWQGGPVCLNSVDRPEFRLLQRRDPLDRDPRPWDFAHIEASQPEYLRAMRAAFSAAGYLWVWGCNGGRAFGQILNAAKKAGFSVTGGRGTLTRDYELDHISLSDARRIIGAAGGVPLRERNASPRRLDPAGPDPSSSRWRISGQKIASVFEEGLKNSYAGRAAQSLGIVAFSVPLGVFSIGDFSLYALKRTTHDHLDSADIRPVFDGIWRLAFYRQFLPSYGARLALRQTTHDPVVIDPASDAGARGYLEF